MLIGIPAQGCKQLLEIGRRRHFETHRLAAVGVWKLELGRVQRLAPESAQRSDDRIARAGRQCQAPPVNGIPDQRVPAMREMHANLMRTAGLELNLYISVGRETLDNRVVSDCGLAVVAYDHALAVDAMAAYRRVDSAATCEHTATYGQIETGNLPVCQQAHQRRVRGQRLADQKQAARVLVEPVDDTGTWQLLELRRMVQQPVQERAARVSGPGVDNEAGRFVDHDKSVVLVHDIQPDGLGSILNGGCRNCVQGYLFATEHRIAGPRADAIDDDGSIEKPCLEPASRVFGKQLRQRLVQSLAGKLDGDRPGCGVRVHRCAKSTVYSPTWPTPGARSTRHKGRQLEHHRTMKMQKIIRNLVSRARNLLRLATILTIASVAAGCAGNDEQETPVDNLTEAYQVAKDAIERQNYRRGIQIFEAIQARFPFSDLSRQIQLELMYAYYKAQQKEQAIEMADTFIRENPIHPRVDYALYIKALSYFEDEAGFLERRFKKDVTERPPKEVDQAYSALRRLVDRYPASAYAADAEQRMVHLKNRLAGYENHVADYYLRRGAYVAALNRAKSALEEYNGSAANAESLRIMARAYEELGMDDLAADTRRVRKLNFPGEG